MHTMPDLRALEILARRIRRYSIISTTRAGSGHPSSCLSAADLMAALFFTQLRYDFDDPKRLDNDRFVLSKGHAAPVLYATWAAAGVVRPEQIETLRELRSDFEGHPTPRLPWIDVATGSLGQGLSNATGMAIFLKEVVGSQARVWVLLGDGEMCEGANWEVIPLAAQRGLDNLVAIVDVNRLEQSTATRYGWDLSAYARPLAAFGWETIEIDGHDMRACVEAMAHAVQVKGRPVAILARTKKGAGVSLLEDQDGWHGKALDREQAERALAELGHDDPSVRGVIRAPAGPALRPPHLVQGIQALADPDYPRDRPIATRRAFGEALKRLGDAHPGVMVFDGDVKNSTFTELFERAHPDRFVQAYIAEQAMVGMAAGAGALGAVPWAATFAAFLTRAYDHIRMAALSQSNLKLCGSHAGTSIGEDGSSQMGLEDLAMFRAVYGSTVVYPADPFATEQLVRELSAIHGLCYLRTTRAATPVVYGPEDRFPVGGSKVLRQSDHDQLAIVAAGITLHEALAAHALLAQQGIAVRVIDAYSIKPIDAAGLARAAAACGGRLITVEDHWIEGGLGDAVLAALAEVEGVRVRRLAVTELPHSGRPEELLDLYGLSAAKIAAAVRGFLQ
ncbi:MAG: transketolase [Myxococcales bacterium]|nr:transketolase [Myxococcota bacterium]MDW8281897.1 transketolase [Myxococcales bacterium]